MRSRSTITSRDSSADMCVCVCAGMSGCLRCNVGVKQTSPLTYVHPTHRHTRISSHAHAHTHTSAVPRVYIQEKAAVLTLALN